MVLNKFKSVKDDKVKRRMTYVENKKENIENFREKIRQISAPKSDNLGVKKPDFLSPRRTHNLNKFLKNSPINLNNKGKSEAKENLKPQQVAKKKNLFQSKLQNNEIDLLNPEVFKIVKKRNLLKNNCSENSIKFKNLMSSKTPSRITKNEPYFLFNDNKHFFVFSKNKNKQLRSTKSKTEIYSEVDLFRPNSYISRKHQFEEIRRQAPDKDFKINTKSPSILRKNNAEFLLSTIVSKATYEKKLDTVIRMKNKEKRKLPNKDYRKYLDSLNRKYLRKNPTQKHTLKNASTKKLGYTSLKKISNKNYSYFKSMFNELSVGLWLANLRNP